MLRLRCTSSGDALPVWVVWSPVLGAGGPRYTLGSPVLTLAPCMPPYAPTSCGCGADVADAVHQDDRGDTPGADAEWPSERGEPWRGSLLSGSDATDAGTRKVDMLLEPGVGPVAVAGDGRVDGGSRHRRSWDSRSLISTREYAEC